MGRLIDLSNQRFGTWTALKYAGLHDKKTWWLCKCDCGVEREVVAQTLRNGLSQSCGCQKGEKIRKARTIHGRSTGPYTRTYGIWHGMRGRCRPGNKNSKKYYHDKGVRVCERWDSFLNFLGDMGEAPDGLTIDRINGNGIYEKSNCRWTTWAVQVNNRCMDYLMNQKRGIDGRYV